MHWKSKARNDSFFSVDLERALQKEHIATAWERKPTLWSRDGNGKGTGIPEKKKIREDNLTPALMFFHIRKGSSF